MFAKFLAPFICIFVFCSVVAAQFEDVSETIGFSGGGKASFADFNGDGWIDVYNGALLKNESGKKFTPVENSGVGGGEGIWGDVDNDGLVDLFVFTGQGALYRNLGKGKFEKIEFPQLPTINSLGAVFLDINNDGLLDLFVGGYEVWQKTVHPDVAYLNKGDLKFEETWRSEKNFSARGVCSADFNEDGFTDVFVSNYRLQPNFLYQNRSGKLVDVASDYGAAGIPDAEISYTGGIKYRICGHTIGSCFGDLDNDGHIDLFVGNFSHPPGDQDRPQFLRNLGPKESFSFEDVSAKTGLAWQESFASPSLGDFDNDGDLDLYFTTVYAVGSGSIKNFPVLYKNDGEWKFSNVTEPQKLGGLPPTYQAAWADVDNDGDLDLATAGKLFRNNHKSESNWLQMTLDSDDKSVNRSAIGTTVRIKVGDKTLTRFVESGTGEGNQNALRLHFGLGQIKEKAITAQIDWLGKKKQTVELNVNEHHHVKMAK